MPRDIPSGLLSKIQSQVSTLTELIKIACADGSVFAFTRHSEDITIPFNSNNLRQFDGVTYKSRPGMNASRTTMNLSLGVDNSEAEGFFRSGVITLDMVLSRKFEAARFERAICDYENVSLGRYIFQEGFVGRITIVDNAFRVELRGLMQALQQPTGTVLSRYCNVKDVADSRCKFPITTNGLASSFYGFPYKVTGTVTAPNQNPTVFDSSISTAIPGGGVSDPAKLVAAAKWFTRGKLVWTSGNNSGRSMEVIAESYTLPGDNRRLTLLEPMGNAIQTGDTFELYAGCDRTLETCRTKFKASVTGFEVGNAENFRGFPHIIGDKVYEYGDHRPTVAAAGPNPTTGNEREGEGPWVPINWPPEEL